MTTLKLKNTFKLKYFSSGILRKIFLINENNLHKTKEKIIRDRSSTIPWNFIGVKVKIYNGRFYKKKKINKWMIGFKFGEFTWNKKLAIYKAKQLKKKKK